MTRTTPRATINYTTKIAQLEWNHTLPHTVLMRKACKEAMLGRRRGELSCYGKGLIEIDTTERMWIENGSEQYQTKDAWEALKDRKKPMGMQDIGLRQEFEVFKGITLVYDDCI